MTGALVQRTQLPRNLERADGQSQKRERACNRRGWDCALRGLRALQEVYNTNGLPRSRLERQKEAVFCARAPLRNVSDICRKTCRRPCRINWFGLCRQPSLARRRQPQPRSNAPQKTGPAAATPASAARGQAPLQQGVRGVAKGGATKGSGPPNPFCTALIQAAWEIHMTVQGRSDSLESPAGKAGIGGVGRRPPGGIPLPTPPAYPDKPESARTT